MIIVIVLTLVIYISRMYVLELQCLKIYITII